MESSGLAARSVSEAKTNVRRAWREFSRSSRERIVPSFRKLLRIRTLTYRAPSGLAPARPDHALRDCNGIDGPCGGTRILGLPYVSMPHPQRLVRGQGETLADPGL